MRQFVTPEEAARRAGVSVRTIRRRLASGELPHIRLGPRLVRVELGVVAPAGARSLPAVVTVAVAAVVLQLTPAQAARLPVALPCSRARWRAWTIDATVGGLD